MPATINGPTPALSNGSGGYQVGSGNLSELRLGYMSAPPTAAGTGTATLTAAQVTGGILVSTPTGNIDYTLPSGADIDAVLTSAHVGSTFDLALCVNASYTTKFTASSTVVDGGGITIANAAGVSAMYRFRKTGDGAWSVYKIG